MAKSKVKEAEKEEEYREPEDLLGAVFQPSEKVSEKYKVINETLASVEDEKIELFSDLTEGQIEALTLLGTFSDIVKYIYRFGHRQVFVPTDSIRRNLLRLSVSKDREGRKEIVKTIAAEILIKPEEKRESVMKRLLGEV